MNDEIDVAREMRTLTLNLTLTFIPKLTLTPTLIVTPNPIPNPSPTLTFTLTLTLTLMVTPGGELTLVSQICRRGGKACLSGSCFCALAWTTTRGFSFSFLARRGFQRFRWGRSRVQAGPGPGLPVRWWPKRTEELQVSTSR